MKIHQTLHGYLHGHSQIASSVDLSLPDKKKMAVLSDWSEYSRSDGSDSSYITTYALPNSSYYVIAKTWYAEEMKRPGCVWTHSLLVDTNEIDTPFDFRTLWSFFKRPSLRNEDFSLYEFAIEVSESTADNDIDESIAIQFPSLAYWLSQMLEGNEKLVFTAASPSSDNQMLLLSLLSHLPIGIAKRMSFCSGTARLRQYDNEPFDLQITSAIRKKIPALNLPVAEEEPTEECYKQIARSVLDGGKEIPILFWKFSEDIGNSVVKLKTVLNVYQNLDRLEETDTDKEALFDETLRSLAKAFPAPDDGEAFKSSMLSQNVTKYFCGELQFIIKMAMTPYYVSFDYSSFNFWGRLSVFVNNSKLADSLEIVDVLLAQGVKTNIQKKVLNTFERHYDGEEQVYILKSHWPFYVYMAKVDSAFLEHECWTEAETDRFKALLPLFLESSVDNTSLWESVFLRVIRDEVEISYAGLKKFDEHINVTAKIMDMKENRQFVQPAIVDYCKTLPVKLLSWLSSKDTISYDSQVIVCETVSPSSELVHNTISNDWRALANVNVSTLNIDLAAYLFILSYNVKDRKGGFQFYRKAFYPIYKAAEDDTINSSIWQRISVYCPKPLWGWEWDRCAMLRRGLSDWVIDGHVSVGDIRRLTPERKLNKKLVKYVNKRKEGKGWLQW